MPLSLPLLCEDWKKVPRQRLPSLIALISQVPCLEWALAEEVWSARIPNRWCYISCALAGLSPSGAWTALYPSGSPAVCTDLSASADPATGAGLGLTMGAAWSGTGSYFCPIPTHPRTRPSLLCLTCSRMLHRSHRCLFECMIIHLLLNLGFIHLEYLK